MRHLSAISVLLTCVYASGCSGSVSGRDNGLSPQSGQGGTGTGGQASGGGSGGTNPGGPNPAQACKPSAQAQVGKSKWRRLTQAQYKNIVRDVLAVEVDTSLFLADSPTGSFATNLLPAQDAEVDRYGKTADTLAATLDTAALAKCTQPDRSCAIKFIDDIGTRLYRRKVTPEESAALLKLFDLGSPDGFKVGASLMVRAMLQSPSFLYLTEFGGSDKSNKALKLTGHETAARLSLLLWNSAPDALLLGAAADNKLAEATDVRSQAERMMKDPRFALSMADFHLQLLHVTRLTQEGAITKESIGALTPSLRKAMVDEMKDFVVDAVKTNSATLETLFTAQHSFPSAELLSFNKLPTSMAKPTGRVDFSDGRRAGLFTMSGSMTAEPPVPTPYGVVRRGKMIRENFLCANMPPPPPGLKFVTPPDAATTPQRVLLEQHQTDPSCSGCHSLMDSVGFAFENFDGLGRYRTKYSKGELIDASGKIEGDTDVDGSFAGPKELGAMLARSTDVRACMATQWFRYAIGREPAAEDGCSVDAFLQSILSKSGDIPEALLAFVQSDSFRFIQGVQ